MAGEFYRRRPTFADDDALARAAAAPYVRVRWDGEHRVEGDPAWLRLEAVEGNGGETRTGMFAEWRWDGATLAAGNDRLGLYPLFYEATPDSIRVSPSLVKLLLEGASRELDEAALAVFLRCGFFVSEQTPFRAIRAVPPGATLAWSRGETTLDQVSHSVPVREATREEAMDAVGEIVERAILRRPIGEGLVMPSSGGRDSRQLLFEMVRQGVRPRLTVTAQHFPPRRNEDTILARRIAAELGLPHRVVKQPPRRLPLEVRNHIETSFCSDEGAWADAMKGTILAEGSETCDGIAGDSQMGHPPWLGWNADRETDDPLRIANALLDHTSSEALVREFAGPDLHRRLSREKALAAVAAEFEKHKEAPAPVQRYFFWNRTRREIALVPFAKFNAIPVVHAPFCDFELHEYLSSLPERVFLPKGFQIDAVNRRHPDRAHIPLDKSVKAPRRLIHPQSTRFAVDLLAAYGEAGRPFGTGFLEPRLRSLRFLGLARTISLGPGLYLAPLLAYFLHLDAVSPLLDAR